jgi:hypothetical protein
MNYKERAEEGHRRLVERFGEPDVTIHIRKSETGLWFVHSSTHPGMNVAEHTLEAACMKAGQVLRLLENAYPSHERATRFPLPRDEAFTKYEGP